MKLTMFINERMRFVMEFMEGGDMSSILSQIVKFPKKTAQFYAAEITLAIEHLHTCGIVHRDTKPGNILFNKDGHCKLDDFGVSAVGMFKWAVATTFCGTQHYMAPKILQEKPYGPEVDWWSFGVTLHRMMVGELPAKVLGHPDQYPSCLSGKAVSILMMLLTEDPGRRLGTRHDMGAIRRHAFFESVDWEALQGRRVKLPFKPHIIQFRTMDPEEGGSAENNGRNSSFETAEDDFIIIFTFVSFGMVLVWLLLTIVLFFSRFD